MVNRRRRHERILIFAKGGWPASFTFVAWRQTGYIVKYHFPPNNNTLITNKSSRLQLLCGCLLDNKEKIGGRLLQGLFFNRGTILYSYNINHKTTATSRKKDINKYNTIQKIT